MPITQSRVEMLFQQLLQSHFLLFRFSELSCLPQQTFDWNHLPCTDTEFNIASNLNSRLQEDEEEEKKRPAERQGTADVESRHSEALQANGLTDTARIFTTCINCSTSCLEYKSDANALRIPEHCTDIQLPRRDACMQGPGKCRRCGKEGHWDEQCPHNPHRAEYNICLSHKP